MPKTLEEKLTELKDLLKRLDGLVVAYSGGVDSTFLLKTASDVLGSKCIAVIARTPFMPAIEFDEAVSFCHKNKITFLTVSPNIMSREDLLANPKNRCYICKKMMFTAIKAEAANAGFLNVCEGSNADDRVAYRPGMKALRELGIISPLAEVGLNKLEIREGLRLLKMPVADKASFSCLATRIPYGETITCETLSKIEKGEEVMRSLGFIQYRVRLHGNIARIEVLPTQFELAVNKSEVIVTELKKIGFNYVTLDLQGFRSGSMDEK
ncbi:MAG: ATP-dependent sacrificial sulfur transferase LarE [Clostridiales bacterium]|nr:ATP-dependent sacrificial sulfur transferase LarE [Clostridiales bacterium]